MFGIQSTLIAGSIGAVATLFCYAQWQTAERETAIMTARLQAAEQMVTTQKAALDEQAQTLSTLREISAAMQTQNDYLMNQRDQADAKTQQALDQIATLRATEKSAALKNPYLRGNFAHERLNDSLQRIARKAISNGQGENHTGAAKTDPD